MLTVHVRHEDAEQWILEVRREMCRTDCLTYRFLNKLIEVGGTRKPRICCNIYTHIGVKPWCEIARNKVVCRTSPTHLRG